MKKGFTGKKKKSRSSCLAEEITLAIVWSGKESGSKKTKKRSIKVEEAERD